MSSLIEEQVRDRYAAVAASGLSGAHAGVRAVAEAFGYTREQLASLPADAHMGLSCGNPTAVASLKAGEVIVDLGCGGGLDVLLAAQIVGPAGRAIGIDMTPEMIARAKAAARQMGAGNVEFYEATIDRLPLPDATADCVISNCVINLAPDKRAVFREMYRVLKPGGRVAVSDIALKKALPPELAQDLAAYVGCVAGAILIAEYEEGLRATGFCDVQVVPTGADLNAYTLVEGQSGCCSPGLKEEPPATELPLAAGCCEGPSGALHGELAGLLARYDINDYAASVQVFALKG